MRIDHALAASAFAVTDLDYFRCRFFHFLNHWWRGSVLDYVVAHGHLPDDDDNDQDLGGCDGAASLRVDGGNRAGSASSTVVAPPNSAALSASPSPRLQLPSTCSKGAALASVADDFLRSPGAFGALQDSVLRHSRCGGTGSAALGEGFMGTRGFICRFNR